LTPDTLSTPEVPAVSRVDFDHYAGHYDEVIASQTRFFDGDSNYFARYKIELARQLAGDAGAVLDFGCGIGRSIPHLTALFPKAEIAGCDLSRESLSVARRQYPNFRFATMDELGADLKFDLVIASNVFHHIPPAERQAAMDYCYNRLTPNGRFVIFEHNPLNPVTQYLVKTCPFDTDAILLGMRETVARMQQARFHIEKTSYCLFFPGPLAALRPLENYLGWLPLGGQYFVCGTGAPAALQRAA
jgi:SAM-dependent methyltransferase